MQSKASNQSGNYRREIAKSDKASGEVRQAAQVAVPKFRTTCKRSYIHSPFLV